MHINPDRPIYTLTVAEFCAILEEHGFTRPVPSEEERKENASEDLVHGINGIARLFGVCHTTAQRYKNTFLRPCIQQNGRTIVCSRREALALFHQQKED